MTVQASCGNTDSSEASAKNSWTQVVTRRLLPHLVVEVSVVPQEQQVGEGQVEAQVETRRVVDLGVPAAQQEGEDGQAKEEQPDDDAQSVEPLEESVVWWRLGSQEEGETAV